MSICVSVEKGLIKYLQLLLSPQLYWVFVKAKEKKSAEKGDTQTCVTHLFFCVTRPWSMHVWDWQVKRAGCQYMFISAHTQTVRVQKEKHTQSTHRMQSQTSRWSLRLVTKHTHLHKQTCRELDQVLWDICWSSIFISNDVKCVTLWGKKDKHRNKDKWDR